MPLLYKYSGAGNDFIILDGRGNERQLDSYRQVAKISELCSRVSGFVASDGRIGADGLMILCDSATSDFRMEYYNSDGSGGMMCGNGGRCIAAFANYLGVPMAGERYSFEAADGLHTAEIVSVEGSRTIVRLGMIDAFGLNEYPELGGWFLNTGTRHFVVEVPDVEAVDIENEGKRLRWRPEFQPEGANVNFIERKGPSSIKIRTFEKGVEAETLACGTGITAAAIVSSLGCDSAQSVSVEARIDTLSVDFVPVAPDCDGVSVARNVFLTGPAELVCLKDTVE